MLILLRVESWTGVPRSREGDGAEDGDSDAPETKGDVHMFTTRETHLLRLPTTRRQPAKWKVEST
jgi:hypothetical protein